jgi:hypothetical protein
MHLQFVRVPWSTQTNMLEVFINVMHANCLEFIFV